MSSFATKPGLHWNWDFGPLLRDVDTLHLLQLLAGIATEGTLGAAAKDCGMSYRSAWNW